MTKNKLLELKCPFKKNFLNTFFVYQDIFPLSEDFLRETDKLLKDYENKNIDWQLEKALRQRNNFLASFAVSKAENSTLTLAEATEVYSFIEGQSDKKEYAVLCEKIKKGERLKQKDHDGLEYFNISKTFQELNERGLGIKDLSLDLLKDLHKKLTVGLDVFVDYLPGFEPYDSGRFRADDKTKVADFTPAPYKDIKPGLQELISWIKKNPSAINIFIFHSALYALHPFKNGNKRLCRVLEHFLLRDIGYNQKNLYSTSYYYHKHKDRYYKKLIEALYKHNLNHFVFFSTEALVFSIIGVITGVLQRNKLKFLENSGLDKSVIRNLKPLIKCSELRFTKLYAVSKRKISRQTFVNYLEIALSAGVINKRENGKNTYYSLAGNYYEETILPELLKEVRDKINFLPNEFINYLVK
jgi:Fic family protein